MNLFSECFSFIMDCLSEFTYILSNWRLTNTVSLLSFIVGAFILGYIVNLMIPKG